MPFATSASSASNNTGSTRKSIIDLCRLSNAQKKYAVAESPQPSENVGDDTGDRAKVECGQSPEPVTPKGTSSKESKHKFTKFSRFCRDKTAWECLCDAVLFPLAQAKAASSNGAGEQSQIRCWSCGCSTGEEAYHLSMMWQHRFAEHFPNVTLSVLGTDISEECIAAAHECIYPHHSVAGLPQEWIEKYFEPLFENTLVFNHPALLRRRQPKPGPPNADCKYRLRDHARVGVSFEVQDVQVSMPAESFDIIMSRNAICLYLPPEQQQHVLLAIATERLRDGGCLMIGCDDHLPMGVQEQANLSPVLYDAVSEYCPFRPPRPVDGLFRRGVLSPLKDGEHPTLRAFLRARGSDVDWILTHQRLVRSLTKINMSNGSKAIWKGAVSDGRREDEGILGRMQKDNDERIRKAAERAQSRERAQSLPKAPLRPPSEAVDAMRSFAARMEADLQRRYEKEAQEKEAQMAAIDQLVTGVKRRKSKKDKNGRQSFKPRCRSSCN